MRDRYVLQPYKPLITLLVSSFTELFDSRTIQAIVKLICSSEEPYIGFSVLAGKAVACTLFSLQTALREACADKAGDLSS